VGGACSTNGEEEEEENTYRLLVRKPKGKKPIGRPRNKWLDKMKMDVVVIGWGWCGLYWSGSGYGKVESCCEQGDELPGSVRC
jgi:hypothetical protein